MSASASSSSAEVSPRRLPDLPFEIVRRILRHRLALVPSFPPAVSSTDALTIGMEDGWEGMPGTTGRRICTVRCRQREDVMQAARVLMRVCKSWKRHLYASPLITASSLLPLTAAVQLGDKKWDDTRLHPHSIPGRYITTLDLSTLSGGYFGPHVTSLSKACAVLLPLLPNLIHLRLPAGNGWGIIPPSRILDAPFVSRLRALDGAQISDGGAEGEDRGGRELISLLKPMWRLEVLSVLGPGSTNLAVTVPTTTELDLPNLHTLTLDGIHHGPLIACLIASELPSLTRLLITSYHGLPGDLTKSFLQTHGHKLLSLAFLPTREWPAIHPAPPQDVLRLCPNLRELTVLLPNPALQKTLDLGRGIAGEAGKGHPLELLTLPKWLDRVSASPSASPAPTHPDFPALQNSSFGLDRLSIRRDHPPPGNPFLAAVLSDPPTNLRRIRVDGFSWVSPKLGRAAQEAGAGGETRVWAGYMRRRGVELVDGEGRLMPVAGEVWEEVVGGGERGRRRGSRGLGMAGGTYPRGVREMDEDGG